MKGQNWVVVVVMRGGCEGGGVTIGVVAVGLVLGHLAIKGHHPLPLKLKERKHRKNWVCYEGSKRKKKKKCLMNCLSEEEHGRECESGFVCE